MGKQAIKATRKEQNGLSGFSGSSHGKNIGTMQGSILSLPQEIRVKMISQGMMMNMVDKATIAVSGGFDPIHKGHIRMLKDACSYGDLIIILNGDSWLERKKGKPFMSADERKEILESIRYVHRVYIHNSKLDDVSDALKLLRPTYFANGGDRNEENTPESSVCRDLGIVELYNIGGEKVQSSSWLLEKFK